MSLHAPHYGTHITALTAAYLQACQDYEDPIIT